MNIKNYSQYSNFIYFNNLRKKSFVIKKIQRLSLIPILKKKTKILFQDPETYLKLPYETSFNFIVGKAPKGPRYNSENRIIPYSVVGNYIRKDQKRVTRQKTLVSNNSFSSAKRKNTLSNKESTINIINKEFQKEDKMKKGQINTENLSHSQIVDIFNKSKKIIIKNKSENLLYNKKLSKEIPKLMHQYINDSLSKQEKALKWNNKYNIILKKIENKICKSMQNKIYNRNKYNDSKIFDSNTYNTSNLMKYSGTEYRIKTEKNNLNCIKKMSNLILNNHIHNWEMSLRRPKNFVGVRREYLNVGTDKSPYWVILTEKKPLEEEKIYNFHLNNIKKGLDIKNINNTCYFRTSSKQFDLTSNESTSNDMNNLEIKGKKLIEVEEKIANQMKGDINIVKYKYDIQSLKNIIFKKDYSINNHSLWKNKSFKMDII